jgi:hypothetical protein
MDERWRWGLDLLVDALDGIGGPIRDQTHDMTIELLYKLINATGELPGGDIVDYLMDRGTSRSLAISILDAYCAIETGMGMRSDNVYWPSDVVEQLDGQQKSELVPTLAGTRKRKRSFRRSRPPQRYGEGRSCEPR